MVTYMRSYADDHSKVFAMALWECANGKLGASPTKTCGDIARVMKDGGFEEYDYNCALDGKLTSVHEQEFLCDAIVRDGTVTTGDDLVFMMCMSKADLEEMFPAKFLKELLQ